MTVTFYLLLQISTIFQKCLHTYVTPASSNQFAKFRITKSIPSDGTSGSGPQQAALKMEFKKYNRRYITFNFKGKGHAQLLFQNSDKSKQFKVEIGGGTYHNKIYIYDHKGKCYQKTVNGITSEHEYRSYWIRWDWKNSQNKYRVHVGLCSDPRKNRLLFTDKVKKFKVKIYHIYISTSGGSTGQWEFASAGRRLGGCGDSIGCRDNSISLKCNQSDISWNSDKTGLTGTCIPRSGYFPTVIFGSGKCRTICGVSNEICGRDETCKSGTCKSDTTPTTTTTTTTTISTTATTTTTTTTNPTTTTTTPATTTITLTTKTTTPTSTTTTSTITTSTPTSATTMPTTTATTTTWTNMTTSPSTTTTTPTTISNTLTIKTTVPTPRPTMPTATTNMPTTRSAAPTTTSVTPSTTTNMAITTIKTPNIITTTPTATLTTKTTASMPASKTMSVTSMPTVTTPLQTTITKATTTTTTRTRTNMSTTTTTSPTRAYMSTTTITTPTGTATAQTTISTKAESLNSYLAMHKSGPEITVTYSQQMMTTIPDSATTTTTIMTSLTEPQDTTVPNNYETNLRASWTKPPVASVAPSKDSELFPFGSAILITVAITGGLVLLAAGACILLKCLACNKVIPFGYGSRDDQDESTK